LPLARFDSQKLRVTPLPKAGSSANVSTEEGDASPSSAPHPFTEQEQKVSGMCPV
jgi:hypothetical protein